MEWHTGDWRNTQEQQDEPDQGEEPAGWATSEKLGASIDQAVTNASSTAGKAFAKISVFYAKYLVHVIATMMTLAFVLVLAFTIVQYHANNELKQQVATLTENNDNLNNDVARLRKEANNVQLQKKRNEEQQKQLDNKNNELTNKENELNNRSSQLDARERNIAQREQEKQQRIERERQAQLVAQQQQQSYSSQSYASSSNDSGEHGYYKNCAAVRRAGKAPLYAGQPGYSGKLDADGDGVACEWH